MQNENFKEPTDENFSITLQKAQSGDNEALEKIINIFQDEMRNMCRYIKMPKEEIMQELYVELISIIRKRNKKGGD